MEFRDLKKQYERLKVEMDGAVSKVLHEAHFISGEQVKELEERLADYVGVKHCITCGNGTDALTLAMMVWNIGFGDAVFVPDFTFFASGECPAYVGATPIFVDVDERTFNMDPEKLEKAILTVLKQKKYIPKAVVAVDLFGQPADYPKLRMICEKYGLLLLEDGAQGFGGEINERKACSFGDISTTSFFPAKPLGCYGDGGAIFTDNDEWAMQLRSLAVHGKNGGDKYDNLRIGMNSRLDTLQAAVLLVKLEAFRRTEFSDVNKIAKRYSSRLENSKLILPFVKEGFRSSWAQYTVRLPEGMNRLILQDELKKKGIPTMVYYARPLHRQTAFAGTESATADCPVAARLSETVLSLPMHPYLDDKEQQAIIEALEYLL